MHTRGIFINDNSNNITIINNPAAATYQNRTIISTYIDISSVNILCCVKTSPPIRRNVNMKYFASMVFKMSIMPFDRKYPTFRKKLINLLLRHEIGSVHAIQNGALKIANVVMSKRIPTINDFITFHRGSSLNRS